MVHTISSIHNVGLCDTTVDGFASFVGEEFAWHEYRGLIMCIIDIELETGITESRKLQIQKLYKVFKGSRNATEIKRALVEAKDIYPGDVFEDPYEQFLFVKNLMRKVFLASETLSDSAILVQAMSFGNYGKECYFGTFTTRDIVTGEDELSGAFFQNSFESNKDDSRPIAEIGESHFRELKKLAKNLENRNRQICKIKFNIENGKLWIIDSTIVQGQSAQAEIITLLDLLKNKVITEEYAINAVQTVRLSEILHPVIDNKSATSIPSVIGGIAGATGAAVGRVFFNTERLIKEFRLATQRGMDSNFILAMPSTYAEDVKAIETSRGVITREGGYASHAPVVARSLGKVAMVNPDIEFTENGMKIGNRKINEGDYISIDVPSYGRPAVYFGKVDLIEPNINESGLIDYLNVVQKHINDIDVHVNADQPNEAVLGKKFLADGIGLCRTEHMFFNEKRINIFRALIISDDTNERKKYLSKLKTMQIADFYSLFDIMERKPVTIRLLDAPLHEFLPHSKESMREFFAYCREGKPDVSERDIALRCDMLSEVNPMLGHRGTRVAITYPEIYRMQVEAIFEAAFKLRKDKGITCNPEIMIPVVMNSRELKALRFGKKIEGFEINGISEIEEKVRKENSEKKIPYRVGTMIELPAAALLSGPIAQYADFFSFGTNDLTQTCLGLSRDDFNSFFTDYSEYDLLDKNPFQNLQEPVKELISTSVERGRMVRPDLNCGLCGEHGAEPDNISFCMEVGLDYVSCSPYGVPAAKLSIAQFNLKRKAEKEKS